MPPVKRQSNAMLYTLVVFVALFIFAVTAAIIYYVKNEELKTVAVESENKLREMVTSREWLNMGSVIGAKQRGKSRLTAMVDYLDTMIAVIIGAAPQDLSAEAKVDLVKNTNVSHALERLSQKGYIDMSNRDPNTTGLLQVIEILETNLNNTIVQVAAVETQLKELQQQFDDAIKETFEKEQKLLAEKVKLQQQVESIKQDYNDLKVLLEQTTEQQIQTLVADLDEEKAAREQLRREKMKLQAELIRTTKKMDNALATVRKIKPGPDMEVGLFNRDGRILLIDNASRTVHLDIGADSRVYRGLTFSVYDKNSPIPKDGEGKAEVEVLRVEKNISVARIIRSQIKKPIVEGDTIANLLWDSDESNLFVVIGEFDLDGDGQTNKMAADKIKTMAAKWGAKVSDTVTVDTDFLLLGQPPKLRSKPTLQEMEMYPLATKKYEESVEKYTRYRQTVDQADKLSIPVLNYEKFLYLTGYKTLSLRPGAF